MKLLRWLIISVIAVCMFLYATNPTETMFIEYAKANISSDLQDKGVTSRNLRSQVVKSLSGEHGGVLSHFFVIRVDHYLYSTYYVANHHLIYEYIGVGRQFFLMEDGNNYDLIMPLYE